MIAMTTNSSMSVNPKERRTAIPGGFPGITLSGKKWLGMAFSPAERKVVGREWS
jgi:hypothetical protein